MAALWEAESNWEYAETGYSTAYDQEPDAVRLQLDEAYALAPANPEHAFAIRKELALAGSPTASYLVAWSYEAGAGTSADVSQALHWYHQAICGGSWAASIAYARLLDEAGEHERCDLVLQDGVDADLATSRFWLAYLKYQRSPGRRMAGEIRPLLDRASEQGHPGAEWFITRLMLLGRFGFGRMLEGIRRAIALRRRYGTETASATVAVMSKLPATAAT